MSDAALRKAFELAKALSEQQNNLFTLISAIQDRIKADHTAYQLADMALEMIRDGEVEPALLQCLARATREPA